MPDSWNRPDPSISVGFVGSIGRACFSDLLLRAGPEVEIAYRTASRQALLAQLAAGRLDLAVHPGATLPDIRTALLCDDQIVVALAAGHPLARGDAVHVALLADRSVLLPVLGDNGDFRRMVRASIPALRDVVERPMADVVPRLADGETIALIAAGQDDELGPGLVTRPIAGADTRFPVRLAWAEPARSPALAVLVAALVEACAGLSPPPASAGIDAGGGWGDEVGGDRGGQRARGG